MIDMYRNLIDSGSLSTNQTPETFLPNPSESDYSVSKIFRYFLQKSNDKSSPVFEVSQDTYNEFQTNPFWSKVELEWRIKGELEPVYNQKGGLVDTGVRNFNLNQIAKFQKIIPPLSRYLINPTQFYKPYRI